jgi:hypothetical protein
VQGIYPHGMETVSDVWDDAFVTSMEAQISLVVKYDDAFVTTNPAFIYGLMCAVSLGAFMVWKTSMMLTILVAICPKVKLLLLNCSNL